jgi:glucose-1-phosphate thymidylyltransferase
VGVVGIVPAAGYATRLQPLNCSKEIVPVGGRPVMDFLVERMRAGGASEIRVVTRPEKRDVIEHAESLGALVVLARPATTSESFAAGLQGLEPEDVALLGWPDTLWEPPDGYRRLVDAVERGAEVALGLFELTADLERSDVISFDAEGRIAGVQVKPARPASRWIWGCAAARVRALEELAAEEWPGSYFDLLCRRGVELHAERLSDVWLDIGTKTALQRAQGVSASLRRDPAS